MRGPESRLAELATDFIHAKEITCSPASTKEYDRYLRDFIAWANDPLVKELLPELVTAYVRERKATSIYVARYAGAVLKSFASWLALEGYFRAPLGGSVLFTVKLPRVPREGRLALEDNELERIEYALARSPHRTRARDTALFYLLLATGIRRNEARELRLEDIHIDKVSFIDVRWETTKGRKSRRIRLDPKAATVIRTYVADWRPAYSDSGPEPVFITEEGKRFTPGGFVSYLARLSDQFEAAGVKDWKAHRMRTTWATQFNRALRETGTSVYDLQREGGWKDDSTPRRYTKDRPWDELRDLPTAMSIIAKRRVRLA